MAKACPFTTVGTRSTADRDLPTSSTQRSRRVSSPFPQAHCSVGKNLSIMSQSLRINCFCILTWLPCEIQRNWNSGSFSWSLCMLVSPGPHSSLTSDYSLSVTSLQRYSKVSIKWELAHHDDFTFDHRHLLHWALFQSVFPNTRDCFCLAHQHTPSASSAHDRPSVNGYLNIRMNKQLRARVGGYKRVKPTVRQRHCFSEMWMQSCWSIDFSPPGIHCIHFQGARLMV